MLIKSITYCKCKYNAVLIRAMNSDLMRQFLCFEPPLAAESKFSKTPCQYRGGRAKVAGGGLRTQARLGDGVGPTSFAIKL